MGLAETVKAISAQTNPLKEKMTAMQAQQQAMQRGLVSLKRARTSDSSPSTGAAIHRSPGSPESIAGSVVLGMDDVRMQEEGRATSPVS